MNNQKNPVGQASISIGRYRPFIQNVLIVLRKFYANVKFFFRSTITAYRQLSRMMIGAN